MLNESEEIKQMYRDAGLTPPEGKGIHTPPYHRCVVDVTLQAKKDGKKIVSGDAKEGEINPHAICMASLGKEKAVNPSHQRNENRILSLRENINKKLNKILKEEALPAYCPECKWEGYIEDTDICPECGAMLEYDQSDLTWQGFHRVKKTTFNINPT
ncbi:MAG: TFIIB-type zinc ribbon-containing protein [Candidatus Omnitrophota bacterium]